MKTFPFKPEIPNDEAFVPLGIFKKGSTEGHHPQDIILENSCGCTIRYLHNTGYELCKFQPCSHKHMLAIASQAKQVEKGRFKVAEVLKARAQTN